MKSELMFKTISEELAKIKVLVDSNNDINLSDQNIFLEDIVGNILNLILGISLENTNLNISNYPSIDLKDDLSEIAVQVTTNVNHLKIQNTLNSFFKNNLNEKYKTLYIVVFDNHNYRDGFDIKKGFNFDKNKHIITYNKLINLIKHTNDASVQEGIYNYVCNCIKNNKYNVDWMINNTVKSLNNLGKKYNKKLNVYNSEERKIELFFCKEKCQNEIYKIINDMIVHIENEDFKVQIDVDELHDNFGLDKLKKILLYFDEINTKVINKFEKKPEDYSKLYSFKKKYDTCLVELKELIDYYFFKVMIYKGVAGIGKSHTLAYFINTSYIKNKKPGLLILGQDFYSEENIEIQLSKILTFSSDFSEMLNHINQLGVIRNINIPIIIDGINESPNIHIWKRGLINLIEQINHYSNLKLIISIRDTYYDFCIPDEIKSAKNVLLSENEGFNTDDLDFIKEFFDFYKIKMPIFQILNGEFSNPLFMTIYCEMVSKFDIDVNELEYTNFIEIYEKYLLKINQLFLEKFKLLSKENIVKNILYFYVSRLINDKKNITYEDFLDIIQPISEKYTLNKVEILNFIIDNGLFYIDINFGKEIIRFSYERYEKISAANYLLDKIKDVDSLRYELNEGYLNKYINNYNYFDNGILEELVNVIQLKYQTDFFSLIDFSKTTLEHYIKINYLKSLVWFKNSYDSKIVVNNIKNILIDNNYINNIIDIFIRMSFIESNPLNITIVDEYLGKLSMPLLDYHWTMAIEDYYSNYNSKTIDNIINYCLNYSNDNINDNSIYLISILLSWLLSSSNRYIRDRATKALAQILKNKHHISLKLLNHFKDVKDMYILERIVAAIYGSVMRSTLNNDIGDLSSGLYNIIYRNDKTIDNIIIKIYSLKFFRFVKIKYSINFYDNIESEKKSKWYSKFPSNEDIDTYKFDIEECKKDKKKLANEIIIDSMVTEYGRGISCYGDFGRYTLQFYLQPFEYLFDDIQLLANVATKRVFEYGYDYKLFGEYDLLIKENQGRHEHSIERIGKKYQWIATYELLSKLYDNFIPQYSVYSDDIIDMANRNYYDLNHLKTTNLDEVVYVHYTLEEENSSLLNIDTTNYILKQNKANEYFNAKNFDASIEEKYQNYLIKNVDGTMYINLFGLYSLEDRKYNLKNVDRNTMNLVCTAIVYSDKQKLEISNFKDYSEGHYNEIFNIQLFDFGNSLQYDLEYNRRYGMQDYYQNYQTCYEQYIWEGVYDESIIDYIKILSPQKWIIKEFGLNRKSESEWVKDNKILCMHPNIKEGKQELLFRYDEFIEFLNKKNLNIAWTIFSEKNHNGKINNWRVNMFYNYKTESFEKEVYSAEKLEVKSLF